MTTQDIEQESPLDEALTDTYREMAAEDDTPEIEDPPVDPLEVEAEDQPETVAEILEALEAPQMWDKRYKEVFSGLIGTHEDGSPVYANGRDVQQTMLDMYGENQKYTTQVEQERGEVRKQLEQFQGYTNEMNNVLGPYNQMISESGATWDTFVRQALGMAQSLKRDPQATILGLAQSAGIDLRAALEGQEWQSPESKQANALERRIDHWERDQMARQQQAANQSLNQARRENAQSIQTFAEAKNESGELLHPHLDAVQEQMAQFIHGREAQRRSGSPLPSMGLDDAYQMACKLDSNLTQAEQATTDISAAARKSAKAKKATEASKRVTAGNTGKPNAPDGTQEDEIKRLYREQVA